jgi:hypothetical protein
VVPSRGLTNTTPRWLAAAETALIVAAPYAYWKMPHDFGSDGAFRLEATRYLANGELLDTPYSLVMSIVALPLYYFGDVVAQFNMFVFFGGLATMAALLWAHVPAGIIRRAVLLLLTASMFGHHTQVFFGEVLTAMLVAVGLVLGVVGWPRLGALPTIVGVANTPAALPALFLAEWNGQWRRVWRAGIVTAICAALIMFEFYVRRGSPFASGYAGDHGPQSILPFSGQPGFSNPFVFGVLAILFSFGKGLALYIPGLWLIAKRTVAEPPAVLRQLQSQSVWFTVGLVLIYAKWWAWPGGWFWGPRFFVFACIPAAFALALHLSDDRAAPAAKALTLGILGWSVWVGINGAVYGQLDMAICNVEPNIEPLCWYSPEFSALFRPFIVAKTLSFSERIIFAYSIATGVVLAAPFSIDLLRVGRARIAAVAGRRPGA